MINPATGALIFVVTGLGGVVTYGVFQFATKVASELKPRDLLPAPPSVGLPLPRFLYEKPELVQRLRRR